MLSVTWVASFLRMPDRVRGALLGGFLVASVAEVALITTQAWRQVPSHFNFETATDTRITAVLAFGGMVLFVVLGALLVVSLRPAPYLDPLLRRAIRCGFGALLFALAIGGIMIAIGTSLVNSGQPDAAYHTAGAFKLAHAVAMHGIALLPGLAWLGRLGAMPEERLRQLLGYVTAAYFALIAAALSVGPVVVWVVGAACGLALVAAAAPIVAAALRPRAAQPVR